MLFPVNFAKFLRTPFLQNTSGRLILLFAFQKQPQEVFYEKRCSWKFRKIHRKTPLVYEIFKNTFLTEHLLTTASGFFVQKWDTANSVWKTSDEYSLSGNTNLEVPFRHIIFFFSRINFQCLHWFTLFTARSSHQSRGVL